MLFSKKSRQQELVEQRGSYRRRQTPRKDIAVHVITPSGTFQGDFRDVSILGVGASFRVESDPSLSEDDVVEVVIKSGHRDEVCTPARAIYGQFESDNVLRYGLEFINARNLYSQLDSFYSQLFNRRNSPRVRPALEHNVLARVGWRSNEIDVLVTEVSATGVGLTMPLAEAYQLVGIESVRLAFRLPGIPGEFTGQARIEKRKQTGARALLGLSFEFEAGGTLGSMAGELAGFVDARVSEMEGWEAAWS